MVNLQTHALGKPVDQNACKHILISPRRFLGTRPIRLVRVMIQRNPAILALSSRSWVNYTHQNLMHFTPLIFENFDYAWSFSAELSPEGLIGIAGSTLR